MISGFFDSEITGIDDEGMPIFDRAQSSAVFAAFFAKLVSNGVLPNPDTSFKASPGGGMNVKVAPGFAMINGYFAHEKEEQTYTLDVASSAGTRIDRLVLQYSTVNREIRAVWKKGTASATPTPPELVRTSNVYEISLCRVQIPAGAYEITAANIFDDRGDTEVCGYINGLIDKVDITEITDRLESDFGTWRSNQTDDFVQWLNGLKVDLDGDVATNHERRITDLEDKTPVVLKMVLQSTGWNNKVYSFESIYPAEQYDLSVEPDGDEASLDQIRAWGKATLAGSGAANILKAYGKVPEINIPVIAKVVKK